MAILSSQQLKNRLVRFSLLAVFIILFLYHTVGNTPSSNSINSKTSGTSKNSVKVVNENVAQKKQAKTKKVKATFVSLARNDDLWELLQSIQSIEDRFNHKYEYDWVFLNDVKFSEEFIKETTKSISGTTKYGLIPYDHWSFPLWIDMDKAEAARNRMKEQKIIYGDSIPYRHMCRYNSGFFYKHPLLDEYDYYWRVEPSVKFFCDINYDVFQYMQDNDLEYGFTIALPEYVETIPTLWDTSKDFFDKNPKYLAQDNSLEIISDDGGKTYNLCHFWSNFEVGKLDFFRGKAYNAYFDYLDKSGGFFYERWGDAPVHSIAAALLLNKEKIHFFEDIGYYHGPFTNCPIKEDIRVKGRCSCNPRDDFTFSGVSCMNKYFKFRNLEKPLALEEYEQN